MKINISKLARNLGKDRRTITKYLRGFTPSSSRKRVQKLINTTVLKSFFYQKKPNNHFIIKEFFGSI